MPTPHDQLAAAFARWAEPTATGDLLQVLDETGRVLAETTFQVRSSSLVEGQLRWELDIPVMDVLRTGEATTLLVRCEGREMTWPVDQGPICHIDGDGPSGRVIKQDHFLSLTPFVIDDAD